jgi:hypothetical protein
LEYRLSRFSLGEDKVNAGRWFDRCGQVGGLVGLLPQGGAGVWTAKKNIGITLARQKITNYLFQNPFQVISDRSGAVRINLDLYF